MKSQETELVELIDKIRREKRYVDIKPFSHNIISLTLSQIGRKFGNDVANRVIRELRLKRLGWSEEKGKL